MSLTYSAGLSRIVNRAVVASTFIVSLAGLATLILLASRSVESIVYGASLALCSFCSFMYTRRLDDRGSRHWRLLDHAAIFILIAGTYTPFVIDVTGPLSISLAIWAWVLALLGVSLRLTIRHGYERLFVLLYILIGWLFLTALPEILDEVNPASLRFLAYGAASYTIGALLFARDIGRWTDPVWHAFVLGGVSLHFIAVLALIF